MEPVPAFAETQGDRLRLRAIVASLDGSQLLRREAVQPVESARALGVALAEGLLEDGAGPILQAARESGTLERSASAKATADPLKLAVRSSPGSEGGEGFASFTSDTVEVLRGGHRRQRETDLLEVARGMPCRVGNALV